MATNLYTPFLEATRNVFQLMLDVSDICENSVENFPCEETMNISIGVIGDLIGEVIYKFPRGTSLSMVNIMSGMEVTSVDDFVTSAISEIANIISGNVLTMLAATDIKCDILPPVLQGSHDIKEYALEEQTCISTSIGDICLYIRLNPVQ